MTTPGGVPNLPPGALTLETLAASLQDMTPTAMRGRAAERFPSIFNSSMGGNPMSDFSFLGLMTQLWGGFNSLVANADPADITGPEDLPGLLITFIEELPIIGELIALIKSIIEGEFELGDLFTAIENIFNTLGSMLGVTTPFDLSALLEWLIGLLLLLPTLLFNLATALLSSTGFIPVSHIGEGSPNLFLNPAFEAAASVQGGDFLWDAAVGRTAAGSGYITADGVEHEFLSNPVAVAAGQKLDLWIYSKWAGLVYDETPPTATFPLEFPATLGGGTSSGGGSLLPLTLPFTLGESSSSSLVGLPVIKVQVVRMLGAAVVGTTDLQVVRSPAADQTTWLQLGNDEYTVPAGCDTIRLRVVVTADVTAGTVWIDDGDIRKTGLMQMPWIEGLTGSLGFLGEGIQGIIDTVFQAITGFTDIFDNVLPDLFMALQNIPFLNVLGLGGPANLGGSLQSTWDQLISGLVGVIGSGAGLADLFNISRDVSSSAALGRLGWDILGIRNNRPMEGGLFSTSSSNFVLSKVALEPVAPTFNVTQSNSTIGFQRIEQAENRAVVSWLGSGVTNLTGAFINIWQMDTATELMTLIHRSNNRLGDLSSTLGWIVYELPTSVHVEPADMYGIEITVQGTGTHSIVGKSTWLPAHPSTFPKGLAATRISGATSPALGTTIAPGTLTYSNNVPWIEWGVTAGDVDIPRSPTTVVFGTAGTTSIPIPTFANFVDVIALGGGGGGQGCGVLWGEGGDGGYWSSVTLQRGVNIPADTVLLNVTVGAGGLGKGITAGLAGGASSVSGAGWSGLTAAGGEGGDAGNAATTGKSPGNYTHNGVTYAGGLAQGSAMSDGAAPGGGGAGSTFTFAAGGHGAPGAVFLVFRQS